MTLLSVKLIGAFFMGMITGVVSKRDGWTRTKTFTVCAIGCGSLSALIDILGGKL